MGQFLNRHVKNKAVRRTLDAVSTSFRVLTGREAAGARATVFPDDVFLTSYPRSGNTWTRFLAATIAASPVLACSRVTRLFTRPIPE
jgi:hypothetical protein